MLLAVAALGAVAAGCRSKVASLRDALLEGDGPAVSGTVDVPTCGDASCLDAVARALGAKAGFDANDPDQATAGAVALVVARDRRGDLVPDPDRWIAALTMARGYGADALRLAVAGAMADVPAPLGTTIGDEVQAAKLAHALAGALPGACDTYAMLDAGVERLPATKRPDASKCVQRDLERKDGPGASWGKGAWRAAAGALALWKGEARALREGLPSADPVVRAVLEAKLAIIEAATTKTELKPPAN